MFSWVLTFGNKLPEIVAVGKYHEFTFAWMAVREEKQGAFSGIVKIVYVTNRDGSVGFSS